MNKTAIKNYAIWARKELIERVTRKAYEYGIEKDKQGNKSEETINGKLLSKQEIQQRKELIQKINENGFDQVMEEVAYTWFNRFIALRFMEVNNYLPNRIRLFTSENNEFKPQILDEALNIELEGLDPQRIYDLLQANDRQELYKELFIASCDDMGNYLPGMFTKINDYKVLLFPDNLLNNESVIGRMISDIGEDSWIDSDLENDTSNGITIIGWLYQFYNTELKAEVFAQAKGHKITKEEIPAATQLFTPDWIVRYLVQNSLGRLYIEKKKNMGAFDFGLEMQEMTIEEINDHRIGNEKHLSSEFDWKFYLPEAKQERAVIEKFDRIEREPLNFQLEDFTVVDPCMGSGHILVYAFNVLMQIYKDNGYSERDAAISILQNNLYGIDIDERAYQLSYFSLMMRARYYNRRIFKTYIDGNKVEPNVIFIQKSHELESDAIDKLENTKKIAEKLIHNFEYADELGSIVKIDCSLNELQELEDKIKQLNKEEETGTLLDILDMKDLSDQLLPLIKQARFLAQKYWACITNPPYLPVSKTSAVLQDYVKKNYPDSKTDLFAVFMEVCKNLVKKNGFVAMITMHSWMFISSYEQLRKKVLTTTTIMNMAHLGARAFEEIGGEVVQTTAFVLRNDPENDYVSKFKRLVDFNSQKAKEIAFLEDGNLYETKTNNFSKIPGIPIVYWKNDFFFESFSTGPFLFSIATPKAGLATGNNEIFQHLWFEENIKNIGFGVKDVNETEYLDYKWYPCNSGGEYRKWYTNNEYVVDWRHNGEDIKSYRNFNGKLASRPQNVHYYFKEGLTWNKLSSAKFSIKYKPVGFIFDDTSRSLFMKDSILMKYILGFMCSKVAFDYLAALNPTLSFTNYDIERLPIVINEEKKKKVVAIVDENIIISKQDWDSFETSWDFEVHPLVKNREIVSTIREAYSLWDAECSERFNTLKANEEELNRIFIDIYGLQDELDPYEEDKDVTVRKADLDRDIRSFISYAVGCMFGRYSLDVPGLAFAGGTWDTGKYTSYIPDADNIIPISSDEYFEDDIVDRFVRFVEVVYGKETLEENLDFIASVLGGKGTSREVIRDYFLKDFYKDHCKIYQKRPIYWLFDSGKKNGFKALMYIHRYQPDLIARLRTQYVFEQQARYRNMIEMDEKLLDGELTSSERVRLNKELKALKGKDEELRKYEEDVHHYADMMLPMDLDDGVKVNYEKFSKLLAKIK